MANSGVLFQGWMVTESSGPKWITGGAIGLEASYFSVGADFLIGLAILLLAIKAGKLVALRWKPGNERLMGAA